MANLFMASLYLIGGAVIITTFTLMGIQIYSMSEEQRAFEAKQARVLKIRREQQYQREQEQKK